ncbi:hypothetical protein CRYUN_Cryun04dG0101400 [Craigia yunnanensis]
MGALRSHRKVVKAVAVLSSSEGNVTVGNYGRASFSIIDKQIPLTRPHSIIGRAVVVHADPDDLGKGGHELSKTTENVGGRVVCGIIGLQGRSICAGD